ncbi:MAG: tetratricopeptide repeat protein [Phaeodactylibacter sp.]|nr:tetratricopeptide repeat protein [Phaeodactylibacter sp.]MCB9274359.1 tetratricopeptide repeat protein [Lewinellaceae bacterium]
MKIQPVLIALVVLLAFSSCQSEKGRAREQIAQLEKAMEANPSTEDAETLIKLYQDYAAQYPDDADYNPRYLYRAAALQFRQNHFSGAATLLGQAIDGYYESDNTPQAIRFLGELFLDNLLNPESATTVFQALVEAFPGTEAAKKAQEKLPASAPAPLSRIDMMASQMFNDSLKRYDYRITNNYIASCELYAMILPNSPDAPRLLYDAAEASRSVRAFTKALKLYEKINTRYPEYEKAPLALFMRAFTLDNDLKRYDEARVLYEEFLAKYPDHDFAEDARAVLENLGKTDEEILQMLEEKNKAKAEEASKSGQFNTEKATE